MALSDIQRVFADILDSIWGKDAQTSIPTQPVSGIAYRDTAAEFETGQKYDSLGESSRWNQLLYLLTGLTSELANFGILPWSAAQPYSKGALCIGSDGTLWQAQTDIAASPTNPVPPGTDDNVWSRPKISGFVPDSIRVIAGTGMTGGGPLSADVTLAAKLTDSVSSTDSTTAASAKAVKAAYDQGTAGVTAANAKLPLSGGTMLGSIQCGNSAQFVVGTQEAPFYQMRARIFGVHSPTGELCGVLTADAASNYFSIEPVGGAVVNSYCGRPGSAFQHGYFANINDHPLFSTITGSSSGNGWLYQTYSNGFIEQWGVGTTEQSGDSIVTFPIPFKNGVYNLQTSFLSHTYPPDFYNMTLHAYSYTTTNFYVEALNGEIRRLSTGFSWYACGF